MEEYYPADSLSEAIFGEIKPIWLQLTDKALLRKCARRAMQNRSEAFNSMLWGIFLKTKFAGTEVLQLSAALTCMQYDRGISMYGKVLETMGSPRGQFTSVAFSALDNVQVMMAQKKATAGYKKSRKRRRRIRKGVKDEI